MTPAEALPQLVLILGVAVIAALVVGFLRLPAVAGFMLAGAVIGPGGLALVKDLHAVELLSEIGVILLLFTIGLEFSLERLRRIARLVAIGGSLQVGLTVVAAVAVTVALGGSVARGVFIGFVVALSSTAIVLRGLSERGETDAPHGRFTIGALIFQDLCVVPMMLLVPILARVEQSAGTSLDVVGIAVDMGLALGKAAAFVVVALVVGRFVMPTILKRVDAARSREVFLIAVLVVCAGVAVLAAVVGLSLALGAFLAGVLLADGSYGQRAMSNVIPLRDLLTTMFFLSLGMLFDIEVIEAHPVAIAGLFLAMFFGKGLIATVACLAMRFPARVAWLAGVGLAQFGEFGFVLAKEGRAAGLLSVDESRAMLTAGLLTMFVTPVAMRLGPHVTAGARLLRPLERLLGAKGVDEAGDGGGGGVKLQGHVIIGGYGIGGRLLSRSLRELGVPYVVLELDAETVRLAPLGDPVFLGDIAHEEALEHAHVQDAAAVVLLLNDLDATRQSVSAIRTLSTTVPLIVRARRLSHHDELMKLGASDVISEELEAGIETLARVLRQRGTPANLLSSLVRAAREAHGETARRIAMPRNKKHELDALADLKIESVVVRPNSPLVNKPCPVVGGVIVVAIGRRGGLLEAPPPDTLLEIHDVLYLVGPRPDAYRVAAAIDPETGDPRDATGPAA
ncbi:MAG: cation:proton antiporter [Deltaproteobacteria bacterium]|nr:cation:proton antiporter [Deltaproteobacteria bacterium]